MKYLRKRYQIVSMLYCICQAEFAKNFKKKYYFGGFHLSNQNPEENGKGGFQGVPYNARLC
jgi:hypothetical protein